MSEGSGDDEFASLHVRPVLRFAYAVEGRATVLTKSAAYRGAPLAAVKKRCDCYHGTGGPDDMDDPCSYHMAIHLRGEQRERAVLARLERIYKAEDERRLAEMTRPAVDLSHMRLDDLELIQVAVDWHLTNGRHRPRRRHARR
jgi:hypothetical protein